MCIEQDALYFDIRHRNTPKFLRIISAVQIGCTSSKFINSELCILLNIAQNQAKNTRDRVFRHFALEINKTTQNGDSFTFKLSIPLLKLLTKTFRYITDIFEILILLLSGK